MRKRKLGEHEIEVPLGMLDQMLDAVEPVLKKAMKTDRYALQAVRLSADDQGMFVEVTDGHMAAKAVMTWADAHGRLGAFEPSRVAKRAILTAACAKMLRQSLRRWTPSSYLDQTLTARIHTKRGILQVLQGGVVMETTRGLHMSFIASEFPRVESVMNVGKREVDASTGSRQDVRMRVNPRLMAVGMRCATVMEIGSVQAYPPTAHDSSWMIVGEDEYRRIEVVIMGVRG